MKAQIQALMVCATLALTGVAFAQDNGKAGGDAASVKTADAAVINISAPHCPEGVGLGSCGVGEFQAKCADTRSGYPRAFRRVGGALRDKFSPRPFYSHGKHGFEAQMTHQWNQQQMQNYPWHCNYNYWQYGRPTALVVPPNSSFQSVYSWGVAQTRSVPIYHQFGRAYPGADGGGSGMGSGSFSPTPYWPANTSQFGVYPVRAPF